MKRYVIFHEKFGIYLGELFGLGFWSYLDPAGQNSAVTFPSEKEAQAHADSWETPQEGCRFVEVEIAHKRYATIAECAAADLPWFQHAVPEKFL